MTPKHPSDKAIYNSRIIDTYIKLLKRRYPEVDISAILLAADMKNYEVADQSHWFTQLQIDRFYDKVVELTGNRHIAREAGRYTASPETIGVMRQYILGMLGPAHAFRLVRKSSARFTRSALYDSRLLSANRVEITVSPVKGVEEKPFQCENRMGFFEAVCLMFNQDLPTITHTECAFQGADRCRYIISWRHQASLGWRRARDISAIVLGSTCLGSLAGGAEALTAILAPAALGTVMVLAWIAKVQENKELHRSLDMLVDSSEKLVDQMNINYSNALMTNEIGQAISAPTAVDEILTKVVQVLNNRLDFDRGMILLANEDESRLIFRTGFGYTNEQMTTLNNIEFNLNKTDSRGVFLVAYHDQTPFLVDDIHNLEESLSLRSIDLAKKLETQAFICCPIICEGKSIGILAVDNLASTRPLLHSDMSQLMGIAPVLGISIRNADLLLAKERQFKSTLQVLAASIESRDPLTAGHSEKVTQYAVGTAETLGIDNDEKELIRVSALLHDYGKIGVPDSILKKEGRLTDEEYAIVKTHTEATQTILSRISFEGIYREVPNIASSHHENIDGTGYPKGLTKEEIPLGARIISVADFFEAITSKRHYRDPMPTEVAYQLLMRHRGTRFDPEIVDAFIAYHSKNHGGEDPEDPSGRPRRINCRTSVNVHFNSHSALGTTEDISTQGMFLSLTDPVKEGAIIHLSFSLPGVYSPPIEAMAKVIWTNTNSHKPKPEFPVGNGLTFTSVNKQNETVLREFIKDAASSSIH